MLDDLKYIHEKDAQDSLGIAAKQWQQLTHDFDLGHWQPERTDFANVVFAGMGGSALGALLTTAWPQHGRPFEICRDYRLPSYVNEHTLLIVSSYSGNTEETVSVLDAALALPQPPAIVVMTSGGQLAERANVRQLPLLTLPGGLQPRHAALYGYKAVLAVMAHLGWLDGGTLQSELDGAVSHLQTAIKDWLPDVPAGRNRAKELALECMGKSVVIYGGPLLFPAAYKWKIGFNENAKNVAWCNQFSEFNHNEFLGWTSHPVDKPYAIIELQSSLEHERIQKRFTVTNRLLSGRWPQPIEIACEGTTPLQQLLWAVVLGDFVTLYAAILNGLNPTPVDLIEKLKTELNK